MVTGGIDRNKTYHNEVVVCVAGLDELGPSSEPSKDLVTSANERLRESRERLERARKSQRERE